VPYPGRYYTRVAFAELVENPNSEQEITLVVSVTTSGEKPLRKTPPRLVLTYRLRLEGPGTLGQRLAAVFAGGERRLSELAQPQLSWQAPHMYTLPDVKSGNLDGERGQSEDAAAHPADPRELALKSRPVNLAAGNKEQVRKKHLEFAEKLAPAGERLELRLPKEKGWYSPLVPRGKVYSVGARPARLELRARDRGEDFTSRRQPAVGGFVEVLLGTGKETLGDPPRLFHMNINGRLYWLRLD